MIQEFLDLLNKPKMQMTHIDEFKIIGIVIVIGIIIYLIYKIMVFFIKYYDKKNKRG